MSITRGGPAQLPTHLMAERWSFSARRIIPHTHTGGQLGEAAAHANRPMIPPLPSWRHPVSLFSACSAVNAAMAGED